MGTETALPPELCAECGYLMDTVSAADGGDEKPQEGDLSLCLNCGAASLFDAALQRRPLGLRDMMKLSPAQLSAILVARRACARARGTDLAAGGGKA